MKIRVLGCYGAVLFDHCSCGFLINDSVLLDAGTVSKVLSLREQEKIRYILISHIHLDHIKGLTSLSENIFSEEEQQTVVILSTRDVLDGLKEYFFNDQVWPDFTRIPSDKNPVFRLQEIREDEVYRVEGLEIRAIRVNHIIPAVGFIIKEGDSSFIYSGDTYATEKLWKAGAKETTLKAALIESTFPNAFEKLAESSKHLTPRQMAIEYSKIGKPDLPIFAYHIKPKYLEKIRLELEKEGLKKLKILQDGDLLEI